MFWYKVIIYIPMRTQRFVNHF